MAQRGPLLGTAAIIVATGDVSENSHSRVGSTRLRRMSRTLRLAPPSTATSAPAVRPPRPWPSWRPAARPAEDSPRRRPTSPSDAVDVQVLPQLAATGEDPEAADDAAWVVDATVADVEEGTPVTLYASRATTAAGRTSREDETDEDGAVALTTTDGRSTSYVVVGDGEDAIGAEVSTDDAPAGELHRRLRRGHRRRAGRHAGPPATRATSACAPAHGRRQRGRGGRRRARAQRARRPRRGRVPAPGQAQEVPLPAQRPRRHRGPLRLHLRLRRRADQDPVGPRPARRLLDAGGRAASRRAARRRAAPRSTSWSTSATTTPRVA